MKRRLGVDMKSINSKIQQINGLVDTDDVTNWENEFISSIIERTQNGFFLTGLSDKQIEIIERIYNKHFA